MWGQPPSAVRAGQRPASLSTTPQLLQLTLRLLPQDQKFLPSPAQSVHDVRRSLRQKLFVSHLLLVVGQLYFDLLQFFLQTLALGGHVDFTFVNDVYLKPPRMPRA